MAHQEVSIILSNGKPGVSSLELAERFGIKHHNVLRDIRAIARKVPADWHAINLDCVEHIDAKGEKRPAFNLTRDGFTLLAMGYNSARAIEWKLKYIEAFNAMEAELLNKTRLEARREALALSARFTPERLLRIRRAAHYKRLGLLRKEVATLLGCSGDTVRLLLKDARSLGLEV